MGIIDGAKSVVDMARAYDKMDLYQKAVELMAQVTDLAQQNFELKQELASLKERLSVRDALVYHANFYWRKAGSNVEGPFCTNCWDTKNFLVRMLKRLGYEPMCPHCKTYAPDAAAPQIE